MSCFKKCVNYIRLPTKFEYAISTKTADENNIRRFPCEKCGLKAGCVNGSSSR